MYIPGCFPCYTLFCGISVQVLVSQNKLAYIHTSPHIEFDMSSKENTPQKKVLKLNITPSQKFSCLICAEKITLSDNRRRIFSGTAKTPIALKFENALGISFDASHGNIVCKMKDERYSPREI